MKLSRKPRTLMVMLLIAVFLMSFSGIALAAPAVNWGTWLGSYSTSITARVYETDVAGGVYANVYASIGGQTLNTPVNTSQYIYGSSSGAANISIPLASFTNLTYGSSYTVSLTVYSAQNPTGLPGNKSVLPSSARFIYSSAGGSGSPSGSSSGSASTTTPDVSVTLGSPATITSSNGANLSGSGFTLKIPAGAMAENIKVTISKVTATAGLTPAAGSKLVSDVLEIIKDKTGDFSKAVTITLSFDKSKVDTDKFDLKVCYYDEESGKWVALDNVSIDLANGKVSGDTTHFTKFAVIAFPKEAAKPGTKTPAALNDISKHWAEANIKQLVASGAVAGYPDGTFKPDKTITRAEFATVVVKAFKLNAASGKVFADTTNHWAKDYIATAAAAGIVNGYGDNKFGPDDLITREQMAVMIVKAAKLTGDNGKTFADSAKVASWAKGAVSTASAAGVINGYPDGSFKPQGSATRAEAVTVIVKAITPAAGGMGGM